MALAFLVVGLATLPIQAHAARPRTLDLSANKAVAYPIEAQIINTGSTNTSGYWVSVLPSGRVRYAVSGSVVDVPTQVQHGQLAKALAVRFFHDLAVAVPSAQIPVTHRFRSVSFGTSTYIEYKGQRTPDLSAPADSRGKALQADIVQIAAALHLKNTPRRPIGPLTPMLTGH